MAADMSGRISRRTLLSAGSLALTACQRARGAYFGQITMPSTKRLVFEIGGEPESLDPHQSVAGTETYVISPTFEGLVALHPETCEPLAGIATHYESSPDNTEFTFYMRGHPEPRGMRLPGVDSLPWEFTRGNQTSAYSEPARFSDSNIITAHDFVQSWRRAVNPAAACALVNFMFCVLHAADINAGRLPVEQLGVWALNDYTLHVVMNAPTPFFLSLQSLPPFYVVPCHTIDNARHRGSEKAWTKPGRIVTSGPFSVKEWKPYEHVRLDKNPHYYDADVVGFDDVVLLPMSTAESNLNLYKSGAADSMLGKLVAPVFFPLLNRKRDFRAAPAFWTMFYVVNTTKAPFNNVLVRYALNMAIDKRAIVAFLPPARCPPQVSCQRSMAILP